MLAIQFPAQKRRFVIHLLFLSFSVLAIQLPMHFLIFHAFHCFTLSIVTRCPLFATRLPNYLHNSLSTVSHSHSLSFFFFSYHRSLYFTLPTLSHSHSLSHSLFFPTTVRRRCLGVVVLQMSDGNEGNAG